MSTRRFAASMLVAAMVLAVAALPAAGQGVQFKKIVMSDQPVPGMPGVTFGDNFWTSANNNGDVLFHSVLTGPGITTANNDARWLSDGTNITKVVREGDQVPGLAAGISFRTSAPRLLLNDSGQVYLKTDVQGPGVDSFSDEYLLSGTPGSLQIIARERLLASQQTPDSFVSFSNNTGTINDSGKVVFGGTRFGEQNPSLWLSSGDSLSRVTPAGSSGGIINDADDIALLSTTSLQVLPAGSASPQNVAAAGDAAPGTEPGVQFANFFPTDFNNAGSILFRPTLSGPGVNGTNNFGFWIGRPGEVVKVLRAGEEVPGLPGVFWGGATFLPGLSDTGRAAIQINVTGDGVNTSNDVTLVTGAPGDIRIIAREGDQAPGLESGTVHQFMSHPAISESGHVAFTSQLTGPGVTTTNRFALYQYDPEDDLVHLLLRSGELLEVAPGDFRTIQAIGLAGLPWHMPDQVSFNATFTDGTRGIFIAAIPEPAGLAILASSLLLFQRRRGDQGHAISQQHHGHRPLQV